MMRILIINLFLSMLIFGFSACQEDNSTTYDDVKIVISLSCATADCHDATTSRENVNCSSYAAMAGNTGNKNILHTSSNGFHDRVLVKKNMPQGATLTTADLNKLQAWVDGGFKE